MLKRLEAIRGFAAIYVVIHHIIGFSFIKEIIGPVLRFPFRFGQEAVIIFFLLSGFVIHYASHGNPQSFQVYFFKRARRIYPIAICSMALSIIIFQINGHRLSLQDVYNLLGNLLMLQDTSNKPGMLVDVFLDNHALWSLSYEWMFYMLYFPLIKLLDANKYRIIKVFMISLLSWITYLIYPNHFSLVLSYLVIWWVGVECASIYLRDRKFQFRTIKTSLVVLALMSTFALIPVLQFYLKGKLKLDPIMFPIVTFRHFLTSLVIILMGLIWWRLDLRFFDKLFGQFERFAPISYAIYVIHFPIIWLVIPGMLQSWLTLLIKIVLMLVISYILERKLQPYVNKLLPIK